MVAGLLFLHLENETILRYKVQFLAQPYSVLSGTRPLPGTNRLERPSIPWVGRACVEFNLPLGIMQS